MTSILEQCTLVRNLLHSKGFETTHTLSENSVGDVTSFSISWYDLNEYKLHGYFFGMGGRYDFGVTPLTFDSFDTASACFSDYLDMVVRYS